MRKFTRWLGCLAACALAALPMVLWEGIHEKGWKIFLRLNEKEVRKKI